MSRMILARLFIRTQLVDKPFKAIFAYSFSTGPSLGHLFEHQILSFRKRQEKGYLQMAACEQLEQRREERAVAGQTSLFAEQSHEVAFTFQTPQ